MFVVSLTLMVACSEPCEPGFGKVDGNCYPIETDGDADTDTDADADADTDTDADADTDASTGDTGEYYTGPTVIDDSSVSCDASDVVRYYVRTQGWTQGGGVFTQETAAPDFYGQYSDEHTLISFNPAPLGWWDELERELETEVALLDAVPDGATVFRCGDHFEAMPEWLSYAAWVYDVNGILADCVVWGHDPTGLVNDAYDRLRDPSLSSTELQSCTILP